ncbi:hypothetical protein MWU76_16430 [Gelidibacter sp. F2691]|nr:hypothetical protein [Gelidibacter sp. F2691]
MTRIRYTKKRLQNNLKVGIFFMTIRISAVLIAFFTGEWRSVSLNSIGIGQISTGVFMLALYYFENKKQYLTLKNGDIIKNTLFPSKINLDDVKSIREFAGDIKLITERKEFVIDTQIIDPNSLSKLKHELKKLNLI